MLEGLGLVVHISSGYVAKINIVTVTVTVMLAGCYFVVAVVA
jgi:hypothetical protein